MIMIGVITLPFVLGGEICDYVVSDTDISVGTTIPFSIPFKNEIFNVYSGEDIVEGTAVIVNGVVDKFECEVLSENNTYDFFVKDKQTIEDIQNSENQLDAFSSALGDSITIEGKSFGKKTKLFFINIAITIASWFS